MAENLIETSADATPPTPETDPGTSSQTPEESHRPDGLPPHRSNLTTSFGPKPMGQSRTSWT